MRSWARTALGALLIAAAPTTSAQETREPAPDSSAQGRDDVLVVANANSRDSYDVARHYAAARGIPENRIVAVRSPAAYTIDWNQFELLRDQIVDFLIRETLTGDIEPPPCRNGEPFYCEEKLASIRLRTTIRHVVLVRGVPTRFVPAARNFRLSTLPTTVDSYLRYHLLNYFPENNAADPLRFPEATNREWDFADGTGMRPIDPAVDREFAIARIDGVTTQAARDLIDRTLSAEANGIYGKLYTNTFRLSDPGLDSIAAPDWIDERTGLPVYGSRTTAQGGTSWRYQLGIWAAPPACAEHLAYSATAPRGESPEDCSVRINEPADPAPGAPGSRFPTVIDAVVYLGALDGQSTTGSSGDLDTLSRWKVSAAECPLLCEDLPAGDKRGECVASSLDAMSEINSGCVAVNEGFVGYNWISWPLSYFAVWPTAWAPLGDEPSVWIGGDFALALPLVSTGDGHGDSSSLWVGPGDETGTGGCYASSSQIGRSDELASCPGIHHLRIGQRVDLAAEPIRFDRGNEQDHLALTLWLKPDSRVAAAGDRIETYLALHQSNGRTVVYPSQSTPRLGSAGSWSQHRFDFVIDADRHRDCTVNCVAGHLTVQIRSAGATGTLDGLLGLDDLVLLRGSDGDNLLANGQFDGGHRQLAIGDHAAVFLNRLGGTAFLGSAGHAVTGGHSFASHAVEWLVYFLRGLPLGEAVWLHEELPTGLLYGDPLYSPTAVKLDYAIDPAATGVAAGSIELWAATVNGRNPDYVDTTVAVHYCNRVDFFICDATDGWMALELTGGDPAPGGKERAYLGRWDSSAFQPGEYTLRLTVTSRNRNSASPSYGREQTLHDYRTLARSP